MPHLYIVVIYVLPADSDEMQTPGELLLAELDRQPGMDRAKLARILGVQWPTVDRWTKNDGVIYGNRIKVARALSLPLDFFEQPDKTQEREEYRQKKLAEFLASPMSEGITEDETASIASMRLPTNRLPTVHFYVGLLFLLRNQLDPSRFEEEVTENEQLADQVKRKQAVEPKKKTGPKKGAGKKKSPDRDE